MGTNWREDHPVDSWNFQEQMTIRLVSVRYSSEGCLRIQGGATHPPKAEFRDLSEVYLNYHMFQNSIQCRIHTGDHRSCWCIHRVSNICRTGPQDTDNLSRYTEPRMSWPGKVKPF